MTLILVAANSEHIIQFSDRRITSINGVYSDEFDKAGYIKCRDSRFVLGFSGLAQIDQTNQLNIHQKIQELFYSCGKKDSQISSMLNCFTESITNLFNTDRKILMLKPVDKKLSVMITGYFDLISPPPIFNSIITNFQDFSRGVDKEIAGNEFTITNSHEKRPFKGPISLIQHIGLWSLVNEDHINNLRSALEDNKPINYLIDLGIGIYRSITEQGKSELIGRQLSTICLHKDIRREPEYKYHSNIVTNKIYFPSVTIIDESNQFMIRNAELRQENTGDNFIPLVVPKVKGRLPCPCGSGKIYRDCHGKSTKAIKRKRHK